MEFLSALPAWGTLFNAAAIVLGGAAGLAVGRFIPERLHGGIFNCLGLFVIYIGLDMSMRAKHTLAVLLSLVLGTVIGDLLKLDARLNGLGDLLKARLRVSNARFTDGFITATLLFCVGAMGVIGAIENGLRRDPSLLIAKGMINGIEALLFASSFGAGVLFSAAPVFLYQGGLTLLASGAEGLITPDMIANISGLGGLMVLGIGLNLLKVTRLRVCDMLPGLLLIAPFTLLFLRIS